MTERAHLSGRLLFGARYGAALITAWLVGRSVGCKVGTGDVASTSPAMFAAGEFHQLSLVSLSPDSLVASKRVDRNVSDDVACMM